MHEIKNALHHQVNQGLIVWGWRLRNLGKKTKANQARNIIKLFVNYFVTIKLPHELHSIKHPFPKKCRIHVPR